MPRRILQGVVVSDACNKTVIVRVERRLMHPIYKKYITRSKKYAAHDEDNRYRAGDTVRIEESRPLSKRKHWIVLNGAEGAEAGPRTAPAAAAEHAEPAEAAEAGAEGGAA